MGWSAAKQKGKCGFVPFEPCWKETGTPVYAGLVMRKWSDSKGFAVKAGGKITRRLWRAAGIVPLGLLALAACSSLPRIGGSPLPPETNPVEPVYRDLADIPEAPPITPMADNEMTIKDLAQDRAKTAQAAEDLRRQPFMQPDSDTKPGF
jgi:hypothetical protein